MYAGAAGRPDKLVPSYVQHTFPLRFALWRDVFLKGVHCVTPAPRLWPPQCLSSKIKNRNRLHMSIGEQEVHAIDASTMPLYLDIDGNITETGGSNFVICRDGQVISPRRNNILWGVSLTVLEEILAEMGTLLSSRTYKPTTWSTLTKRGFQPRPIVWAPWSASTACLSATERPTQCGDACSIGGVKSWAKISTARRRKLHEMLRGIAGLLSMPLTRIIHKPSAAWQRFVSLTLHPFVFAGIWGRYSWP